MTNPHNPLGRTYPLGTLLALARFAQEEDLQLLWNEIYAKSIYDNVGTSCVLLRGDRGLDLSRYAVRPDTLLIYRMARRA